MTSTFTLESNDSTCDYNVGCIYFLWMWLSRIGSYQCWLFVIISYLPADQPTKGRENFFEKLRKLSNYAVDGKIYTFSNVEIYFYSISSSWNSRHFSLKKKLLLSFFDASTLLDKITGSINNLCLIRSESDAMSEVV